MVFGCLLSDVIYTILTSCSRLVINKLLSGYVCVPCDCLLMISLSQVFNRLVASSFLKLVIKKIIASCVNKSASDKLQQSSHQDISTDIYVTGLFASILFGW